jgi:hypothetical protein
MTDTPKKVCLFIGGSVDGQRIEVDSGQLEIRLPSLSGQPALQDPLARASDDDPIPDESVVYEVYRRLDVESDAGETVVYALNGLGEDAISAQLTKHFGSAESAPLM